MTLEIFPKGSSDRLIDWPHDSNVLDLRRTRAH